MRKVKYKMMIMLNKMDFLKISKKRRKKEKKEGRKEGG